MEKTENLALAQKSQVHPQEEKDQQRKNQERG
jgi:hypothetical protein